MAKCGKGGQTRYSEAAIQTPDRAHGVQAAIAIDRGLDGVGHRIDGPGDFGAGSYGGQPSSGNATGGTREAGATRSHCKF